jgi:hypothetical protein
MPRSNHLFILSSALVMEIKMKSPEQKISGVQPDPSVGRAGLPYTVYPQGLVGLCRPVALFDGTAALFPNMPSSRRSARSFLALLAQVLTGPNSLGCFGPEATAIRMCHGPGLAWACPGRAIRMGGQQPPPPPRWGRSSWASLISVRVSAGGGGGGGGRERQSRREVSRESRESKGQGGQRGHLPFARVWRHLPSG